MEQGLSTTGVGPSGIYFKFDRKKTQFGSRVGSFQSMRNRSGETEGANGPINPLGISVREELEIATGTRDSIGQKPGRILQAMLFRNTNSNWSRRPRKHQESAGQTARQASIFRSNAPPARRLGLHAGRSSEYRHTLDQNPRQDRPVTHSLAGLHDASSENRPGKQRSANRSSGQNFGSWGGSGRKC